MVYTIPRGGNLKKEAISTWRCEIVIILCSLVMAVKKALTGQVCHTIIFWGEPSVWGRSLCSHVFALKCRPQINRRARLCDCQAVLHLYWNSQLHTVLPASDQHWPLILNSSTSVSFWHLELNPNPHFTQISYSWEHFLWKAPEFLGANVCLYFSHKELLVIEKWGVGRDSTVVSI